MKEKGLECPSVRLGVDGFALLPGQSLACLRAEDELMAPWWGRAKPLDGAMGATKKS